MDPERGHGRLVAVVLIVLLLIAAFLVLYPHHVEVVTEGDGKVTPSGDNTIRFYQELELTIEPGEDCTSYVYVDGVLMDSDIERFTFGVGILDLSGHTIRVVFVPDTPEKKEFRLTVTSEGDGTVTPYGETMYSEGEIANIVMVPSEGNVIQSISVDGELKTPNNILNIVMDSDHTVHVVFRPVTSGDIPVIITVDVDIEIVTDTLGYSEDQDYGSVSPMGVVYVTPHGSLTITVSLNPDFYMKDMTVDDVSVGAVTEHTITDITKPINVGISIVKKVPGFIIKASAGKGGSISPSGDVKVEKGKDMTFVFKPASGYKVSTLTVDDKAVTVKSNSYTFTDVQSAHTIVVTFQPIGGSGGGGGGGGTTKTLTGITVTQKPTKLTYNLYLGETTFDPSGMKVTAYFSDSTSMTVPAGGYTIDAPASFTTPGVVSITVSYTYGGVTKSDSFTVTVIEGSASLTSISILEQPDRTVFPVGQTISLDGMVVRAYLSNGDHMDLGPEDISSSPKSFNSIGDKEVTISYTYRGVTKTCTLTVSIVDESVSLTSISILRQPDRTVFPVGQEISLEDMVVRAYLSNGDCMDLGYDEISFSPKSFDTIGDKTITVSYTYMGVTKTCTLNVSIVDSTEYRLTVSYEGNGTVTPSGETTYLKGDIANTVIVPSEGNVIQSISVDGNLMAPINDLDIVMDSDHTVHVVFRPVSSGDIPVTITVDVEKEIVTGTLGYYDDLDYGTVSPIGTVYVVPHGSLTISVTLNQGFEIKGISVNGIPQNPQTEFTIADITEPTSVELSIVKKIQGFIIKASAGTGGSISPSGDVKVEKGEDITFTFTPASGYTISTLTVDGRTVTPTSNSYTFTDVQSAHTISVTFKSTGGGGGGGGDVPPTPSITLTGISVERQPYSTYFKVGDTIRSLDGIVVRAQFSNGTYDDLGTDDISWTPTSFDSIGEKQITISYTYNGVTKTCSLTVTILDGNAFNVTVTSYHGTKVVNGSIVSFSQTGLSESLTGFTFDLNPAVPGITQTITLRIDSDSRLNLDAMLYVRGSTDDVLAKQIVLTAEYNGQTASGTVFQLNGNTEGSFLNLGHVETGSTVTVTVSFPHSEDNNLAMGHSLSFYLGVSAMEHMEDSA